MSDFYESAVGLCDSATGEVIELIPVKSSSQHALLSGNHLFVTHHEGNALSIVDLSSHTLVAELEIGTHCLEPAQSKRFVFVVCSAPHPVLNVISVTTLRRVAKINLDIATPQFAIIAVQTLFIADETSLITAIDISGYI